MKTITPQIRRAVSDTPPARPASLPDASVELHIGSVVFHGFSRADGHRASAALQRELTHLITTHGIPAVSAETADCFGNHFDAGTIHATAARPELTGVHAARAIHRGLGP